ncbi:hypothetical protein DZB84_20655 [Bacillus sp. HNG]|uniref:hypothetical protein n=1 Tax=Bacillus sp. HNG TaxID=2293325 RepID=UPI000E2FC4C2|nr:hypothetical protein [Bacillus sp. HNG]RFB11477.1 hypothetical protein DZB84_20655 [Bacillus sp. HNG]
MKMDDLKKQLVGKQWSDIKIPEIKFDTTPMINTAALGQMNETIHQLYEAERIKRDKKEAYEQDVLRTLKNIEANTKGLDNVVSLLMNLKDQQDEVLDLLKEILAISTSPNLEAAESKYRQIMNKVNAGIEDFNTMQTLMGFANTIYQMYKGTLG